MVDLSRVTYTASAAQDTFAITFDYQVDSHISVDVNEVDEPNFSISGGNVVLDTPLAGGEEVTIYRDTSLDQPVVDFTAGGAVTEANLDDAIQQAVFLAQEAWDRQQKKLGTDSVLKLEWDAVSQRLINLADPSGATDAVTLQFMEVITDALASRVTDLENGGASTALPPVDASDRFKVLEVDDAGEWVAAATARVGGTADILVRTNPSGQVDASFLPPVATGVDGGANVGGGIELFRDITSAILNFRTLVNNSVNALSITLDGDAVDYAIVFSDGDAGAADKFWSSQKVETELAGKSAVGHGHTSTDDISDMPATVSPDAVLVGNPGGTAYDAVESLNIDVPDLPANRIGHLVFFDDAGDGVTLPKGSQRQVLTMSDAATSIPEWAEPIYDFAKVGPSVSRLLVATDFQAFDTAPGWEVQVTEQGQPYNWQRAATAYLPPGALKNGGSFRVFSSGEFSPGSSDPGLGLKLQLGADELLPVDPVGADAWMLDSDTVGWNTMHRLPANSRWYLDVTVHSLGQYAAASGSRGGGNGTVFVTGKLWIGGMSTGTGDATQMFPLGLGAHNMSLWAAGGSYTAGEEVWLNGMVYIAIYDHTAQTNDEPGRGLFWKHHWRQKWYEFQINQVNDVATLDTWTGDQGLEIHLWAAGPKQDSTVAPAAYRLTGSPYAEGERAVGTDGRVYTCVSGYDPDNQSGAHGTERQPITGTGTTYGPWNQFWVDTDKGYSEMHIDCIEMFLFHGLAGYEPVLR